MIRDGRAGGVRGGRDRDPFLGEDLRDYRSIVDELAGLTHVAVGEHTFGHALEIQSMLAARGSHRALSLLDLLVAAAGEGAGLLVLHDASDFEIVVAVTGESTEWVLERGAAD